jgi:hypothetical protein
MGRCKSARILMTSYQALRTSFESTVPLIKYHSVNRPKEANLIVYMGLHGLYLLFCTSKHILIANQIIVHSW